MAKKPPAKRTKRKTSKPAAHGLDLGRKSVSQLHGLFGPVWQDARKIVASGDALDAEIWMSDIVSMWDTLELIGEDSGLCFGKGLVRYAQGKGGVEGLLILAALEAVAAPDLARRAKRARAQVRPSVPAAPSWISHIGRARPVRAWQASDGFHDVDAVTLVFSYPEAQEHVLLALIDNNLGGVAKDVLVAAAEDLEEFWGDAEEAIVEDLDFAVAAARVLDGVRLEAMSIDAPSDEDVSRVGPLIEARLRRLSLPEIERPEMTEDERDALCDDFLDSPEAASLDRDSAGDVAWRLVDLCCDYLDGDPLRWSPRVVEICLCSWFPMKVMLDSPVEGVPDVVRAWARYAARRKDLATDLLEVTLAAVDEFEDEFLGVMSDGSRSGVAKSLVTAMLAEGIDPVDQGAMERWIDDFNSRPYEERTRVMPVGPSGPVGH